MHPILILLGLLSILCHQLFGQIIPINNNSSYNSTLPLESEKDRAYGGEQSAEAEEPKLDAEWACGTDDFSRFLAEATIDRDCPEKKNAINNCCVRHDNCYDQQQGLKQCDDTFCSCLDLAAQGSDVCAKEDAPYFCQLVRQFGQHYYNASANPHFRLDGKSAIVPVNGENQQKRNRGQRSREGD